MGKWKEMNLEESHLNLTHKIINTTLSRISQGKNVRKMDLVLNSLTCVFKPHTEGSTILGITRKGTRK